MPYKHAHYFVGVVLLVIIGGFWASYFSIANGPMPLAFHVHAITSMAWLMLLIAQHVAIHRRANALHKQMGKASFAMFPLLMLGFVMIINVSAQRFAVQEGPGIVYRAPAFGIAMVIALAAYVTLFYLALKHRRNVKLHAGYMLVTPMILFESPFGRLMDQYFPWLNIIRTEGPHEVLSSIAFSDGMMVALAMALYFMDRKHGAPWLLAAAFIGVQAVVVWFAPSIPGLATAFGVYATIPQGVSILIGLAMGVSAGWLGWRAGGAGKRKPTAVPA
ncbi:MAG: hypothetical protein EP350_03870 [Alphaproteobacteria bacterium]|nr:MAG: hypothetical protein EP350_03870 [Alphaproteobacteria bacterium]